MRGKRLYYLGVRFGRVERRVCARIDIDVRCIFHCIAVGKLCFFAVGFDRECERPSERTVALELFVKDNKITLMSNAAEIVGKRFF